MSGSEHNHGPPSKKQRTASEEDAPAVILVTGGRGLVGKALEEAVKSDPSPKERWIFLSKEDGDLW